MTTGEGHLLALSSPSALLLKFEIEQHYTCCRFMEPMPGNIQNVQVWSHISISMNKIYSDVTASLAAVTVFRVRKCDMEVCAVLAARTN